MHITILTQHEREPMLLGSEHLLSLHHQPLDETLASINANGECMVSSADSFLPVPAVLPSPVSTSAAPVKLHGRSRAAMLPLPRARAVY
jgi:hypothetical protein